MSNQYDNALVPVILLIYIPIFNCWCLFFKISCFRKTATFKYFFSFHTYLFSFSRSQLHSLNQFFFIPNNLLFNYETVKCILCLNICEIIYEFNFQCNSSTDVASQTKWQNLACASWAYQIYWAFCEKSNDVEQKFGRKTTDTIALANQRQLFFFYHEGYSTRSAVAFLSPLLCVWQLN